MYKTLSWPSWNGKNWCYGDNSPSHGERSMDLEMEMKDLD